MKALLGISFISIICSYVCAIIHNVNAQGNNRMTCGLSSDDIANNNPLYVELQDINDIPQRLLIANQKFQSNVQAEVFRISRPDDYMESTSGFPWIAQVRFSMGDQSQYICGACIISEFFVLTTARCASSTLKSNGIIRVGDYDIRTKDPPEEDYQVESVSTTTKGKTITNSDIALIKIKPDGNGRGIRFNDFIRPACLPTIFTPYMKSMVCEIAGYGRDEFFKASRHLKKGSLPLMDRRICLDTEGSHNYLEAGLFCAGGIPWASTGCSGDRGSPIVCKVGGRTTVVGIDSISGCNNPGRISYYADVQYHLSWIASEIKSLSSA